MLVGGNGGSCLKCAALHQEIKRKKQNKKKLPGASSRHPHFNYILAALAMLLLCYYYAITM